VFSTRFPEKQGGSFFLKTFLSAESTEKEDRGSRKQADRENDTYPVICQPARRRLLKRVRKNPEDGSRRAAIISCSGREHSTRKKLKAKRGSRNIRTKKRRISC
jgi:hypothetical protein